MSQFEPDDIDQLLDEHDRLHSRSTGSGNWEVADAGALSHDEEEPPLHTVTTQGHQLAVTTTEEEAVATVETYQRAGYPDLDVVTAAADAPWASPPPATAPDAEDELSPERLDDENRATDWIREHDGEPAEGARPDPDSEFVWKDGALQYDGPQVEPDEPTQVDPDAVAVYNERIAAGASQEDAFGAAMSHQDEQRAIAQGPQSSYFTDEELADVDPNFSYGPDGEPRTRADAASEWVTDPDWDGTDPFVEAYREPTQEVWEHWEKEAQGRTGDTAEAQVDAAADGDTYVGGVSRGERLDDQVDQAREALGQLADDSPSAGRSPAASTSNDDDARER